MPTMATTPNNLSLFLQLGINVYAKLYLLTWIENVHGSNTCIGINITFFPRASCMSSNIRCWPEEEPVVLAKRLRLVLQGALGCREVPLWNMTAPESLIKVLLAWLQWSKMSTFKKPFTA